MSKKKVFLLGGYDLEMLEIKNILDSKNFEYKDKNLSWGNAKLSAYKSELETYNEDVIIYGIELESDVEHPKNYVVIDHHGKFDDNLSSLEQVAKILDINLSDYQKLIAANDSRYISGMENICAPKDQIDDIRKKDRELQGITAEDEKLAKESIEAESIYDKNIILSKTPKFSAVSDLAYYKFDNYVIYNNEKILFYGYKKENIQEFLKSQNIEESEYYYGGGEFGYIGIKDKTFNENKIKSILEEFKKFDKKEEIYSYHTFMLPFTFKCGFDEKKNWKYKDFELNEQRDYNEYIYFYKHIQDAIYNKDNSNISKYYEYEVEKGKYTINCIKGIFELQLDGLSLRIFNTEVAILSFNLKNTKYKDLDSILAINDFGRRIYPQFLGKDYICDTKKAFLSNSITLQIDDKFIETEDFTRFNDINNLKDPKRLNLLPSFISKLIEENFNQDIEKIIAIRPIIDDRMFVISLYMNDALVADLQTYKECSSQYKYEMNDFWYKYIFIDGDSKTCQSKHMMKKLISESTYDRWVDWGTLFGISRYSFVSITGSWFGKNRLLPHIQTMYFQIFTLLLAYRATIIKFSDDIQNTTNETIQNIEKLSKETEDIYEKYLGFLNKLYFKEVTAQDQGIELYNQAMKVMDIEKYMNDLNHEITQLHTYVTMQKEKERNNKLEFISKIGAILLPPTLLAGLFGMNVLTLDETQNNQSLAFVFIIISALIGFFMTFNFKLHKNIKIFINILSIIGTILFIGYFLYFLDIKIPLLNKFDKKTEEIKRIEIINQPIDVFIAKEKEKIIEQ
ncbi:CorA family divalent cation transporter [Aliarcobacter cryaerophilus]|uniref:CorA family divalent cation transporter n=1 Tax=Aliarcobacter cryaerophilus TaxID=28198 RepID=UPI003DA4E30B